MTTEKEFDLETWKEEGERARELIEARIAEYESAIEDDRAALAKIDAAIGKKPKAKAKKARAKSVRMLPVIQKHWTQSGALDILIGKVCAETGATEKAARSAIARYEKKLEKK